MLISQLYYYYMLIWCATTRHVLDSTDHIMLVGQGANKFAERMGMPFVSDDELVTADARAQYEAISQYQPGVDDLFRLDQQNSHDTVGAVAMDIDGNIAAATSTGGITYKMAGRVGDSPILGKHGQSLFFVAICFTNILVLRNVKSKFLLA